MRTFAFPLLKGLIIASNFRCMENKYNYVWVNRKKTWND